MIVDSRKEASGFKTLTVNYHLSSVNYALIHKPPLYPKPDDEPRGWVMRCSKIIMRKTKAIGKADGIQVFGTNIGCKCFYAKVKEGTNIR